MDENRNYNIPEEEEEGIDIMALVRQLWDGRKTIIIVTCVFIALGLVAALTMKRTYTVQSLMVPQMNSKNNSQLSSLAALAGVDMGMDLSAKDLSPLVYPQIVNSVPFKRELLYEPLHYAKADSAVSTYTYYTEILKPSFMSKVKKYTIGLPFTILGALQKEKPDVVLPSSGVADDSPKPVVLTKKEVKLMEFIGKCVNLTVDKKEGILTLTVVGTEPIQTAELALKAQNLLQSEITRFRTEKAQRDLNYIQGRYDEAKKEAESLQASLAAVRDRSQGMIGSRSDIQRERIQLRYNVANAVYTDMAKQLEQAKLQVKRDTPVLAVIQPVTVPSKASNSRAKKLIVWTFLGFVLGCGWVLGKGYWPKLKEQFTAKPE
jgi:LPS O-antigen subunit length determinant protein (WzzB/FepE family)